MEVYVNAPTFSFRKVLAFPTGSAVRNLVERFDLKSDLYVVSNGRLSDLDELLHHGSVYHLELRLRGGKGGFGSMLRALGAQIEKTTNREACRDLSGRRLRDVNHEKEMAEWLKKQAEREAERDQRRAERLQRKRAEPKHLFTDPQYQQQCHDLSERLEESVLKGLQASSSTQVAVQVVSPPKRPSCDACQLPAKKKKSCYWTGVGELLSSEEDEEEDEESQACCGFAVVAMETQKGERAEPEASSSRTPRDRAAGPPDTSGDPATGPPETFGDAATGRPETSEDAATRPPETSGDAATGPPETCGDAATGPPKTSGDAATGPPETPREPIAGTSKTSEDRVAGPSEERRPDSVEFNRSCQLAASLACVGDLEALGLDVLKGALLSRGLKCGGTLSERAARLLSVRGLSPDQIDPALLAKPARK